MGENYLYVGKYLIWVFNVMLSSLTLSEIAHCLKMDYILEFRISHTTLVENHLFCTL